ncbi:hypothetical protein KCP69_05610 [Salmonella enterica subsp. enterica]|nr:hypothetical protein KCP69_05610 [Salmonella enterica subsp. enterica]
MIAPGMKCPAVGTDLSMVSKPISIPQVTSIMNDEYLQYRVKPEDPLSGKTSVSSWWRNAPKAPPVNPTRSILG